MVWLATVLPMVHRLAHGAPFMSTVEQKVEIFAHLYIVLNFHMFEFMGI